MKKILFKGALALLFLLTFTVFLGFGQIKTSPKHFIGLNMGWGVHEAGELKGVGFNAAYEKKFGKRFFWASNFGGTLHDGAWDFIHIDQNNKITNSSIRYTTGGIQSTLGLNYNFIQTAHSEVYLGLSSLFRYQSTSLPSAINTIYPGTFVFLYKLFILKTINQQELLLWVPQFKWVTVI